MKVKTFLEKTGISEYHLNVANEKEKNELIGLFQFANNEINRVKQECREFYQKLNYSEIDINREINKALNSIYPSLYHTLKLNGWFFRMGQWQRKHKEDYEKVLNEVANLDEDAKWKKLGRFFDTHRIPREFRFEFDGMKVKKVE